MSPSVLPLCAVDVAWLAFPCLVGVLPDEQVVLPGHVVWAAVDTVGSVFKVQALHTPVRALRE